MLSTLFKYLLLAKKQDIENKTELKIVNKAVFIQAEIVQKWLMEKFKESGLRVNILDHSKNIETLTVFAYFDNNDNSFMFSIEEMKRLLDICSLASSIEFYSEVEPDDNDLNTARLAIEFPTVLRYSSSENPD